MAVPKKKTSKSATSRRHKTYQFKQKRKMQNALNFVKCSECSAMKVNHRVCVECGMYKGIQIIEKKVKKATEVIQA